MNNFYKIIFSFFIITGTLQVNAQIRGLVYSDYYTSEDFNVLPQNWCVAQDQRGLMYFGNSNCVLEYDGVTWRKIFVTNHSNVRSLDVDQQNNIFVGAYNEFGLLTPDKKGKLHYKTLTHLIDPQYADFGDVWNTHCIGEEVFFLTEKTIFRYKNQQFSYWEKSAEHFYLSFKINQRLYIHENGKGLMVLENDSLILVEKGDFFADKRIHSIISLEPGRTGCIYITKPPLKLI